MGLVGTSWRPKVSYVSAGSSSSFGIRKTPNHMWWIPPGEFAASSNFLRNFTSEEWVTLVDVSQCRTYVKVLAADCVGWCPEAYFTKDSIFMERL